MKRRTNSGSPWKPPSQITTARLRNSTSWSPCVARSPTTLPASCRSAVPRTPRSSVPPPASIFAVKFRNSISGPRPCQSRPGRRGRGGASTQRISSIAPPLMNLAPLPRSQSRAFSASAAMMAAKPPLPTPSVRWSIFARISASGARISFSATCTIPPENRALHG